MFSYIIDALGFTTDFPTMGWKWTFQYPNPIHIYYESCGSPNNMGIFTKFVIE